MTVSTENPMEAVAALMDERARYEGWLTTLETRRASTPQHVYERVSADYRQRLRGVMEQLAGRSNELKARADALRAEAGSLKAEEDAHQDERAEAELRAIVGEHTPEQWEEIRERCDAAIERLSVERGELTAELERVQQILAVATSHGNGPQAAAGRTDDRGTAARETGRSGADGRSAGKSTPVALDTLGEQPGAFDDMAFLRSVVGPRGTSGPTGSIPPANDDSPTERISARGENGETRGGSSSTPSSSTSVSSGGRTSSSTPAAPRSFESSSGSAPAVEPQEQRGASIRRPTPHGVPAYLKDVPAEQAKTLKCQECGTMNYPTEWYCERCGGELAAM